MVHSIERTRETRTGASELKFFIPPAAAPHILEWVRSGLLPDPHGTGAFADEYDTTTVYFDTADLDVLSRRGSYGRAKFRVRGYGGGREVFLERKLRKPGLVIKRRTLVVSANGHRGADQGEQTARWFYRRLRVRALGPVCQITYRRVARILPGAAGTARVTLDTGLRALAVTQPRFHLEPGMPFLQDRLVLELKYPTHPPILFKRLVEEFGLSPVRASKYRSAMAALGFAAHACDGV